MHEKKKPTRSSASASTPSEPKASRDSAFEELGFQATIESLCEEVRELYVADEVPWILGYSGGKDSTATLQIVWTALASLPADQRKKPIHVISTDTLVENPVVAAWVTNSLLVRSEEHSSDSRCSQHVLGQPHRARLPGSSS